MSLERFALKVGTLRSSDRVEIKRVFINFRVFGQLHFALKQINTLVAT